MGLLGRRSRGRVAGVSSVDADDNSMRRRVGGCLLVPWARRPGPARHRPPPRRRGPPGRRSHRAPRARPVDGVRAPVVPAGLRPGHNPRRGSCVALLFVPPGAVRPARVCRAAVGGDGSGRRAVPHLRTGHRSNNTVHAEGSTAALDATQRTRLGRRAQLLAATAAGVSYNAVEAVIAISAGMIAGSSALVVFGLDSVVEVSSGLIILWQFRHRLPQSREQQALRLIALSLSRSPATSRRTACGRSWPVPTQTRVRSGSRWPRRVWPQTGPERNARLELGRPDRWSGHRHGRLQGRPAGVARRGLLLLTSETGLTSTSSVHGLVPRPTNPVTSSTEETQQ